METVASLLELSDQDLHDHALRVAGELDCCTYRMGVSLLAAERRLLYELFGCGSVVQYGVRQLGLHPQKASELIRASRALERLPALAEAFRTGRLGWGKIRELTRVACPDSEEEWLEYALEHNTSEVQVAITVSPLAAGKEAAGLPPGRKVRLTFDLTPEEYALYERAEELVRREAHKRLPRTEILMRLARARLAAASPETLERYPIVAWVEGRTGRAWFKTDRGPLPAPAEKVLEEARAVVGDRELVPPRKKVPLGVMRALVARSGNCCECCGGPGPLDVHHIDPVSEGGENLLANLLLACKVCHAREHREDFKPGSAWQQARERRMGPGDSCSEACVVYTLREAG